VDSLLVRIHSIIEIMFVDRPCAMGVWGEYLINAVELVEASGDQTFRLPSKRAKLVESSATR